MKSEISLSVICVILGLQLGFLDAALYPEPCDNNIYCYGPLLNTVQLSKLYTDDKSFVDLALKHEPEVVLTNFNQLGLNGSVNGNETNMQALRAFVESNFENGTEFEEWKPSDWIENPKFLENITNTELRSWAKTLHSFWEELGRKIREEVKVNNSRFSMHYVSHPVIVPGGRFKEFYYWDSYWIQKGLIVSEMTETVQGMIENFFEMVESIGYIPNGGRIYYERSQPPLLLPMVKNFYEATKNLTFIVKNINTMEKEFDFFMTNRTKTFTKGSKTYTMARYNVDRNGPRPESYSKDYELVESLNLSEGDKEILYANLKAGAESGWDFSSRWFVLPPDTEVTSGNLSHTKTRDIIPVDLNGFLYWNAVILTEFCQLISGTESSCKNSVTHYQNKANEWKTAIKEVLWDDETGSWYDYNFETHELNKQFFPTNLVPLWVKAQHNDSIIPKVVKYLSDSGATSYAGGIPSSLSQTGQQWDFPNGWAPLNHMVVEALEYSENAQAKDMAFNLAQKWIRTNHKAYLKYEHMFEKYDVSCEGCAGGGGEYEVVIGFGWTNGVILDFLKMYGDRVTPSSTASSTKIEISLLTILMTLLTTLYAAAR